VITMSIEITHVPTYIKEAAGALHRYCQSGEAHERQRSAAMMIIRGARRV
jgi:hypothetical protein